MAELTKFFASNSLYEAWKDNKEVPSNVIAVVLDETGADIQKVAIGTNNIDGEYKTYMVEKAETPQLQAVGYMLGDYQTKPLYKIGSGEDYPCDALTIGVNQDNVTTYEGYIYLRYNRGLTEEEVTAEKAKITGENIESNNIEVNTVAGEDDTLEIIWRNTDEYLTTDNMFINYDGIGICSFNNNIYNVYSNTGIILIGNDTPITAENWDDLAGLVGSNIIIDRETTTANGIPSTGEYYIMIMTKDYGAYINLPVQVLFNNGTDTVKQYNVTPYSSFPNNGLRGYIFNIQEVPTDANINNVEIYWGNATYKIVFI